MGDCIDAVVVLNAALPEPFTKNIQQYFGKAGRDWLQTLPRLLAKNARQWSLILQPPFSNLSFNYVAPAVRKDGTIVVLKAGVPSNKEILTEIEALRIWDGNGCVQLLAADVGRGMFLLEYLQPGTPLTAVSNDDQATTIAAQVMQQLWQPIDTNQLFPTVQDWFGGLTKLRQKYKGGTGPFPEKLIDKTEIVAQELLNSMETAVLLHGDLHHDNIIKAGRQPWLAIDPKGVLGEPAYEIGALLRNPIQRLKHTSDLKSLFTRRIDQLHELLGFDKQRMLGWGMAQMVLGAWWANEDSDEMFPLWIHCAELLADML